MKHKKRGRPPKDADRLRKESVLVRLEVDEKEAFKEAAGLAGLPLSAWVRERLRKAARLELSEAGQQVPFVQSRRGEVINELR